MAGSVTQRTHSPSFWKAIDCIGWAGSFPRTNGQNRSIAFRSANELGFAPRPCRRHASRKFFFFQRETASLLAARISLQSKPRRASDLNPCEGCLRILLQRNGEARRSAYSQQLTVRTAADSKDGRVLDEDAYVRSRVEVRELYDLTVWLRWHWTETVARENCRDVLTVVWAEDDLSTYHCAPPAFRGDIACEQRELQRLPAVCRSASGQPAYHSMRAVYFLLW